MAVEDYTGKIPNASCAIINGPTLDDLRKAHEDKGTKSSDPFRVRFTLKPDTGKPAYEVEAVVTGLKEYNRASWEVTGYLTQRVPSGESNQPSFRAWYTPEETRGYLVAA